MMESFWPCSSSEAFFPLIKLSQYSSSSWINFFNNSLVSILLGVWSFLPMDSLETDSGLRPCHYNLLCFEVRNLFYVLLSEFLFLVSNFHKVLSKPGSHLHSWHICMDIHIH